LEPTYPSRRSPSEYPEPLVQEEETGSIVDFFFSQLDIIVKGRWIMVASVLIALVGSAAYNFSQDDEFDSFTVVKIDQQQQQSLASLFSMTGGGLSSRSGGRNDQVANELVMLQFSLEIPRRAADRMLEEDILPITKKPIQIIRDEEGELLTREQVARRLIGAYTASPMEVEYVSYLRIDATSGSPEEASYIANVVTEAYTSLTRDNSRRVTTASRQFLEEQEEQLRGRLSETEDDLANFVAQNPNVQLDAGTAMMVEQLTSLESQRDMLEIQLQGLSSNVAQIESELNTLRPRLAERISSSTEEDIRLVQERMAALRINREDILAANPTLRGNTSDNKSLRDLEDELAYLSTRLDQLSQAYVEETLAAGGVSTVQGEGSFMSPTSTPSRELAYISGLQRDLVRARIEISGNEAQRDVINRRVEEYSSRLRNLPQLSFQLVQLERSQQVTAQLYTNLMMSLQESQVAEQSEFGYATIIREAIPPRGPARPDRAKNILLTIALFSGIGFAIAWARFSLDRRIYTPEDVKKLGNEVLGVIPDLRDMMQAEYKGLDYVKIGDEKIHTSLLTLLKPLTPISEAYRQFRTNIQFSRPDAVIQVLLGTSATAGEGKTTTNANLAIVMAQSDRKTLLVDCDLRRPRMHRVFQMDKEPGLIDLLFENERAVDVASIDWNEALASYETSTDNLFLLPAGRKLPNPSEFLGSQLFRDFLRAMREIFDVIIIDTPPVLVGSDAQLVSTQVDGAYMIVRSGEVDEKVLDQAEESLLRVGAPVIGYMLNGFNASRSGGYTYQYRYQYYNYGSKYKYGYGKYGAQYGAYGGYYRDDDDVANEDAVAKKA
jgi:capsular exopolysaccharide synthesis family protein